MVQQQWNVLLLGPKPGKACCILDKSIDRKNSLEKSRTAGFFSIKHPVQNVMLRPLVADSYLLRAPVGICNQETDGHYH